MNTSELLKKLNAEFNDAAHPEEMLARAGEIIKAALNAGETADLFGLFRVKLEPAALTGAVYGRDAVKVIPLPALLSSMRRTHCTDETRRHTIALVVDEFTPALKVIERQLRGENLRTVFVAAGLKGLETEMARNRVDAVMIESSFSEHYALRQWLKGDRARSKTALLVLYEAGEPPLREKLIIAEDGALVEPYEEKQLNELIDSEIERVRGEYRYFAHLVSFYVTAANNDQQAASNLLDTLARQSGLSEEGVFGVIAAFREALDNAIRYGCKDLPDATVKVDYALDYQKIVITVQDQGPGFDSVKLLSTRICSDAIAVSRQRQREGLRGGLGMLMMLRSVDKVEYNQTGNIAILTKYLTPKMDDKEPAKPSGGAQGIA